MTPWFRKTLRIGTADRRRLWQWNTSAFMQSLQFTDDELLAWFDEQLPVDRLTAIERALRDSERLRHRAAAVARRRDQGGNSVGEIWRRRRLSCPTRAEMGSYLLESLEAEHARYVEFHVHTVGCRFCLALLDDMKEGASEPPEREVMRRRLFESSAGLLPRG